MRYIKQFIVFIILAVAIILNSSTGNASKKTSGKDAYGNDWSYDAETKTLTFTGEGKAGADFIMDGHSDEPEWFVWSDDTEKVVFSGNITEIGDGTCSGFSYIKYVVFPDLLEKIGDTAFFQCTRLEEIIFPDSLRVLGEHSFSSSGSLKKIQLNEGLEIIGRRALANSAAKKMIIPSTVTQIGDGAFFANSSLEKIIILTGVESIGDEVFKYCRNLKKVTIPSTVTKIGVGAFSYSGIKKIEIPESVKNIFCEKDAIILPEEKGLFLGCKNLKKVVIKSKKITNVAKNSFYKTNKKVKIYVPKGKKKKYTKMFREKGKLSKKVRILAIK